MEALFKQYFWVIKGLGIGITAALAASVNRGVSQEKRAQQRKRHPRAPNQQILPGRFIRPGRAVEV